MAFAKFMASSTGRIARIVVGIILVVVGLAVVGGTGGIVLAVIGLVPILAGAADVCLFAALLGLPISGKLIRER